MRQNEDALSLRSRTLLAPLKRRKGASTETEEIIREHICEDGEGKIRVLNVENKIVDSARHGFRSLHVVKDQQTLP
jgi:hypothetical protein